MLFPSWNIFYSWHTSKQWLPDLANQEYRMLSDKWIIDSQWVIGRMLGIHPAVVSLIILIIYKGFVLRNYSWHFSCNHMLCLWSNHGCLVQSKWLSPYTISLALQWIIFSIIRIMLFHSTLLIFRDLSHHSLLGLY